MKLVDRIKKNKREIVMAATAVGTIAYGAYLLTRKTTPLADGLVVPFETFERIRDTGEEHVITVFGVGHFLISHTTDLPWEN